MRTRTSIKTPILASLTACGDARALPGTPREACIQFGGAGRLRPGRQEPLCDSGRTVICPTCSQATAASRLIVFLPRQRLDFRAAHRLARTYSSNLCRSHKRQISPLSSTSAPATIVPTLQGRRRPEFRPNTHQTATAPPSTRREPRPSHKTSAVELPSCSTLI